MYAKSKIVELVFLYKYIKVMLFQFVYISWTYNFYYKNGILLWMENVKIFKQTVTTCPTPETTTFFCKSKKHCESSSLSLRVWFNKFSKGRKNSVWKLLVAKGTTFKMFLVLALIKTTRPLTKLLLHIEFVLQNFQFKKKQLAKNAKKKQKQKTKKQNKKTKKNHAIRVSYKTTKKSLNLNKLKKKFNV